MTSRSVDVYGHLSDVHGWFNPLDQALLGSIMDSQRFQPPGDLVELGVYFGKSAILIGHYLRPGERFTVCDIFETKIEGAQNQGECDGAYPGLTRAAFEANYLNYHPTLPTVVQAPTSTILENVPAGSCRFAHVDASHIYEHVAQDVDSVRAILRPDGVAAFDDFQSEHTPGTAAAIWEAVFVKGLRPICLTPSKLYGTWGDPAPTQDVLLNWLAGQSEIIWDEHQIAGSRVLRLWTREDELVTTIRGYMFGWNRPLTLTKPHG